MQRLRSLSRLWAPFSRSNASTYAASSSFFILLSVFPAVLFFLALLPYLPISLQQWLDFISNSSFTPALNAACYLRAFGRNDCVEVAFEAAPEGLLIPRAMIANNWMLKGAKNAHQEVGHKRTGIFEQTVGL